MDITQLILDDHQEQRRLFAIIDQLPDENTGALSAVWHRLATFLETHAKAEEVWFYPQLLKQGIAADRDGEVEDDTEDAIKDHNEIRAAIAEVSKTKPGTPEWRKAVMAANKANGDHMAEEEREGLTIFRQTAPLAQRHDLGAAFIAYELQHLEGVTPVSPDPKKWVKEHEE